MRVIIRTDASAQIGGGHMMRCLAIANALRDRGAQVAFVMARTPGWLEKVHDEGFRVFPITPTSHEPDPDGPVHAPWLCAPWQEDAQATALAVQQVTADWLIWDHYGLDARWVAMVRAARAGLRIMAIDDLDDRPLGSDVLLDQTALDPAPRTHPALAELRGPCFATLRPEFAALRAAKPVGGPQDRQARRVLVTLGLADGVGLVPDIAAVLAQMPGLKVDIVMGSGAQTLAQTQALSAVHGNLALHVDTPDMAKLMAQADLCIGAGGMTSWERCALGLGTLLVPIAPNQEGVAQALVRRGAVALLDLQAARDPVALKDAILHALEAAPKLGRAASALCDGRGTDRVLAVLFSGLRPVTSADARLLFGWRDQPHVRAASLNTDPLDWTTHLEWIQGVQGRQDGRWWVYSEGERPLGHVNARAEADGFWRWGFYIGAQDAPKGAGRRMLACALAHLLRLPACKGIRADVRADNPRSVALHKALGFRQSDTRDAGRVLVFCLHECDMRRAFSITFPKEPST